MAPKNWLLIKATASAAGSAASAGLLPSSMSDDGTWRRSSEIENEGNPEITFDFSFQLTSELIRIWISFEFIFYFMFQIFYINLNDFEFMFLSFVWIFSWLELEFHFKIDLDDFLYSIIHLDSLLLILIPLIIHLIFNIFLLSNLFEFEFN